MALLLDQLRSLRSTYWFVPSIMAVAAILLSILTLAIDVWLGSVWVTDSAWAYTNKPEGARAVLSTVAGSMITVAGVTFSMTIAAVSYAAASIGPRLMSNFMRDRGNQITLGVFISTFLYCLLILRTVRSGDVETTEASIDAFVPQISLMVTLLLTLASVGVLIYFIHHVPESINVSHITARVGREFVSMADHLFPNHFGAPGALPPEVPDELPTAFNREAASVYANRSGYLREIDQTNMLRLAAGEDLIIRIDRRPGEFISAGQVLARVWPPHRLDESDGSPPHADPDSDACDTDAAAEEASDRDASEVSLITDLVEGLSGRVGGGGSIASRCRSFFATGNERSHHQNLLFLVDELVEIAARAVSPGINDPFTAMTAIDWLQTGLLTLGRRADLSPYRYDQPDGDGHPGPASRLRIIARPVSFGSALASCFDQLTPYAAADRNAALRLMGMAEELAGSVEDPERRASVLHHAKNLHVATGELLSLAADRRAMEVAYRDVVAAAEGRGA